jgi:uncharacterized protein YkwD
VAGLSLLAAPAAAASLNQAVVDEINFARGHPAQYARMLRQTQDEGYGGDAFWEAIEFLERQPPLPPLDPSRGLALAAAGQAAAQGPTGRTGHYGADRSSPTDRIHRQGVWSSRSAEAISYGYDDAGDVVRQLIIDDGVPGRGHRMIIFDPALRAAGAGCGYHTVYRYMCVIDFAGEPVGRQGRSVRSSD